MKVMDVQQWNQGLPPVIDVLHNLDPGTERMKCLIIRTATTPFAIVKYFQYGD